MGDMSLVGTRPPTVDEYEKNILLNRSVVLVLSQELLAYGR